MQARPSQGDVEIVVENKTIGGIVECVRYLCLFALYGGVAAIVYSVLVIEAKPPHKTPLVSPMMKCTMILAAEDIIAYQEATRKLKVQLLHQTFAHGCEWEVLSYSGVVGLEAGRCPWPDPSCNGFG